MSKRVPLFVLVAALSAASAHALFFGDPPAPPAPAAARAAAQPAEAQLPPNHPPIGATDPHADFARVAPVADERAALAWKMPSGWSQVDNPSRMRLATYRPPRAPGDAEDAELSVSRAGGTTEANVHRWVGQFDDAGPDRRRQKRVNGLAIEIVEVDGTYLGGMMGGGGEATRHAKWALLGAVVETEGSFYFFKMVGPAATVRASRASFDAMLDAVTKLPLRRATLRRRRLVDRALPAP